MSDSDTDTFIKLSDLVDQAKLTHEPAEYRELINKIKGICSITELKYHGLPTGDFIVFHRKLWLSAKPDQFGLNGFGYYVDYRERRLIAEENAYPFFVATLDEKVRILKRTVDFCYMTDTGKPMCEDIELDDFFELDFELDELNVIKSIADFRQYLLEIDGVYEVPEDRLQAAFELAVAEKTGADVMHIMIW